MTLQFDESFEKSIKKIDNKKLQQKIIGLIEDFENAKSLAEIKNIKKCRDFKHSIV